MFGGNHLYSPVGYESITITAHIFYASSGGNRNLNVKTNLMLKQMSYLRGKLAVQLRKNSNINLSFLLEHYIIKKKKINNLL